MKGVVDLTTETLLFLESKSKITEYFPLGESLWLSDVGFVVDLFEHLKDLNTKHKGSGIFSHEIYSTAKEIKWKIKLFYLRLSHNIIMHVLIQENTKLQMKSMEK
ncbi:hypothetical protein RF11_12235 [Thelohanellus kitauei]|uniref:Uncharacterized protein n=1 Tax=Thelohanellus kitauei TaxID=669202 RepID=A0A0C2MEP6_THEKT|nr:hypothetical protein RF11_12235 [Thelohanellus kitauei]